MRSCRFSSGGPVWSAAAWLLAAVPAPAAAQSEAAIARAREILSAAVARAEAPGLAVAVASGGKIVWSEGLGHADLERGVPATPRTQFGVGSISKTFTLAAALVLQDARRLDLDAPVERYLPDFPHPGRGITLRRIAVHQSGLEDAFAGRHYYSTTHFPDLESAYREIRNERLVRPPGSRAEYATGLFTIIGRAMEAAGGAAYTDLMRQRLFQPAGMTGTLPHDPRNPPRDRASLYARGDDGTLSPVAAVDPSHKLPGAGFLSTAEDVARFGAALLGPALLSDRARRDMFTPVPLADGTPTPYALGFQALREDGRRVLLQPGGGVGITAWLALYPDHGLVVAILSNAAGAPLDRERREVAAAFLDGP